MSEPLSFELSSPGRKGYSLPASDVPAVVVEDVIPREYLRNAPPALPELSEPDVVRHFTHLSELNYSIDSGFYPLGSCTMKYNPKLCDDAAAMPGLTDVHPAAPVSHVQGWLELLVELEETLCALTGMHSATLQPPAGAAGELTGLLLMRAWHEGNGEGGRRRVIIPDSAHGTNP
ncbi:MAG: aminomethyl-transferring glycine dehydrogenase subunit GcvPB, partial [Chloroflexi bacterium]